MIFSEKIFFTLIPTSDILLNSPLKTLFNYIYHNLYQTKIQSVISKKMLKIWYIGWYLICLAEGRSSTPTRD